MTYDGFISYSHAADGRLAPAVQHGLHHLAKPWHRRRALWIFRDQTGLAVTPELWSSITKAIDGSEYFVLMASPDASRSPWVNREIEHWIATKSASQILPVVTDGEWRWDAEAGDFAEDSTAVPPALRGVFTEEPLYLDLRWARDDLHLTLRHSRFRDAIAQLAAPMHGVSKDDLEGEDVRLHRRTRRLLTVGAATLVVLTLLASLTGILAARNAAEARAAVTESRRQQQVAEEQRGSAARSADDASRQEELARQQEERARNATTEADRQERVARDQTRIADQASMEAARQQTNAQRQRANAERSRENASRQEQLAQSQRRLAQRSATEAQRQQQNAQEQQRLAREAAEETRRQQENAREQERLAREAAEETKRQRASATEQQRIAVSRRLINQARSAIGQDPATALMLDAAAQQVAPDAQTRSEVTDLAISTRYAGTVGDPAATFSNAAYGPDALLAVSIESEPTTLWDATDHGHPVRLSSLGDAVGSARAMAFSPDGGLLVVANGLWNVADRSHPARIGTLASGTLTTIETVAFSPDGHTVVAGGAGGTVLWDITDPAELRELKTIDQPGKSVNSVAFGPDGLTVATATESETILWDLADRTQPQRSDTLPDGWGPIAFSPTGDLLATAGAEASVKIWNMKKGEAHNLLDTKRGHTGILSMAFSGDGTTLATGGNDKNVILWDTRRSGSERVATTTRPGPVFSVAFSQDGKTLAAAGLDSPVALLNTTQPAEPALIGGIPTEPGAYSGALAFSRDGHSLVRHNDRAQVAVWDVSDPHRPVERFALPDSNEIWSATFSRDGRLLITGGGDDVTLWDVSGTDRPRKVGTPFHQDGSTAALALSDDGHTLAVGSYDLTVSLWDITNQAQPQKLSSLPGHYYDISSMAFSPDGHTLATVGSGRDAILWNVANRIAPVRLATLKGHGGLVEAVGFSPDGRTLATGAEDRTAMLWDLTDKGFKRVATLAGPFTNGVTSVVFSPDGHTLVTGSRGRVAVLWDLTDRVRPTQLAHLFTHYSDASLVALSSDGHTLATAGASGSGDLGASFFDLHELDELRANPARHICTVVGRGLDEDEWSRYIPEFPYQPSCAR
jgi:WD40 repeat protein